MSKRLPAAPPFFDSEPSPDEDLLRDVLELERLTDGERSAFSGMLKDLEDGRRSELSVAQGNWARSLLEHAAGLSREEELLTELLGEDLRQNECDAFESMRDQVRSGRRLTGPQSAWVEGAAERLGLSSNLTREAPSPVPEGIPRDERLLPFERVGYVKPTRPPGRR